MVTEYTGHVPYEGSITLKRKDTGEIVELTGMGGYDPRAFTVVSGPEATGEEPLYITSDRAEERIEEDKKKLTEITSGIATQMAGIQEQVDILTRAKAAGMTIAPTTTVREALEFLGEGEDTRVVKEPEDKRLLSEADLSALGLRRDGAELTDDERREYERLEGEKEQLDQDYENAIADIDRLRARASVTHTALVNSIKQQFDARRKEMREINRRTEQMYKHYGYRTQSFRYSPTYFSIISAEERASVDRIAALDAQEYSLIIQAQQAHDAADWKYFGAKMAAIEKLRDEKTDEFNRLRDKIQEKNEKIREQATKVAKEAGIVALYNRGVTDPAMIFANLNLDEDGNLVGDVTMDEITSVTDNLAGEAGLWPEGAPTTYKDYILEGGLKTGKSYADWKKSKEEEWDTKVLTPSEAINYGVPLGTTWGQVAEAGIVPPRWKPTGAEGGDQYKQGLLLDKDDGMTYEEAVRAYGPYLSLDWIRDIYGIVTAKGEVEEAFYEEQLKLKEEDDKWLKKLEDNPGEYRKDGNKIYKIEKDFLTRDKLVHELKFYKSEE